MLGIRPATGDLPGAPEIEFLSWSPRSWLYHNFLTDEECDHIVKLARDGGSQRSSVSSSSRSPRRTPGALTVSPQPRHRSAITPVATR